jgi:nucleotide-binding universal stress UspA family protein
MYKNILYPTDGSEGAETALEHCRNLATTYEATVHVLYVAEQVGQHGLSRDVEVSDQRGMVGDPEGEGPGMVGDRTKAEEKRARVEEHGTALVEEVASRFGDAEVKTAVQEGKPYAAILDYVDAHDIDLVVMGTHGRTGIDRYLLGSVTEKIVRTSDVPVLTVRQDEDS